MKLRALILLSVIFASAAFAGPKASVVYSHEQALEILGLKGVSDTPASIKAAYRAGVKRFHPDAGTPEASKEKFNEWQEAYDVLTGKLEPGLPPGGMGGGKAHPGGAPGGFHDFTNPFDDAQPQWKPSGEVPGSDPFVQRFGIAREAEGRFGDKASFTFKMKDKFEAQVKAFEGLTRSGKGKQAVEQFLEFEIGLPPIEQKIMRDVVFTLIGEQSRRSTRDGDTMLKALFEGIGIEELPDLLTVKRELRLGDRDYPRWAERYPETSKWLLTNPGLSKLDYETQRGINVSLMSEESLKKSPRFYEELAKKNGYVRAHLETDRIKRMFSRSTVMSPPDFEREKKILLENLKNADSSADAARFRILNELMGTNRDVKTLLPLVEEAMKVQEFNNFHIIRTFNGIFTKGEPQAVMIRKEMLGYVLKKLVKTAPEIVAREKKEMGEFFQRIGTKDWEETIAFVDSFLSPPPPPGPVSPSQKILAAQCSELYAKNAKLPN